MVWSTAYPIFVPCSLKIDDATSSKMYYVMSHKALSYELAIKRRLATGSSFSELLNAKKRRSTFESLRNFTLPVFKLRNTHRPFTEVLAFLRQSFSGSTRLVVSCIVLQLPSHL